jgi:hypothetical protein
MAIEKGPSRKFGEAEFEIGRKPLMWSNISRTGVRILYPCGNYELKLVKAYLTIALAASPKGGTQPDKAFRFLITELTGESNGLD